MFVLPPLPPKDYVLKDVNQNQKSCQEHTPIWIPRITQANLGKYCAPINYRDNEKLANIRIDSTLNPQVLERWTDQARAFWVEDPGKNAYFLHDIFKKYSVRVAESYDPRFRYKEHVFPRSFKYELDCMETERLQKLCNKMRREENEEKEKQRIIDDRRIQEEKNKVVEDLGVRTCRAPNPFWLKNATKTETETVPTFVKETSNSAKQPPACLHPRWQEKPNPLKWMKADPCQRRDDMALIGQLFHSEACNWYYKNYPPPNLPFIPKRFK